MNLAVEQYAILRPLWPCINKHRNLVRLPVTEMFKHILTRPFANVARWLFGKLEMEFKVNATFAGGVAIGSAWICVCIQNAQNFMVNSHMYAQHEHLFSTLTFPIHHLLGPHPPSGDFLKKNAHVCVQNVPYNEGIILRYMCWGIEDPTQAPSPIATGLKWSRRGFG